MNSSAFTLVIIILLVLVVFWLFSDSGTEPYYRSKGDIYGFYDAHCDGEQIWSPMVGCDPEVGEKPYFDIPDMEPLIH